MKKFVFLLTIVLALTAGSKVMAQLTDQDIVVFNVHFEDVLDIEVLPGGELQTITIDEAAEFNNGVDEINGIVPGFSDVSVEATVNWNMTISAPDFIVDGTGTGTIPIDNLGVWCEASGTFNFGAEVMCDYTAVDDALGLTIGATPLITKGSGNAGDVDENLFRLHWLFGTSDGSMNPTSLFDQIQAGQFTVGDFTTTATLMVTQVP